MGLIRFAIKSSVAGGLVYYTIQEGLWSKPEESVKLYGRIYSVVVPYIKRNVPKEVANELPDLPSTSDISNFLRNNWNSGVLSSMQFLANLPTHTSNGINSLMSQPVLNDLVKNISGSAEDAKKVT